MRTKSPGFTKAEQRAVLDASRPQPGGGRTRGRTQPGRLSDPLLYAHARGYCASRRIRLHGWRAEDFEDCLNAVEAARRANHPAFLGIAVMSRSFFESYRSQEREAARAADEGLLIGLELGDSYLYVSCQVVLQGLGAAASGRMGTSAGSGAGRGAGGGKEWSRHGLDGLADDPCPAAHPRLRFCRRPRDFTASADPRARWFPSLPDADRAGGSAPGAPKKSSARRNAFRK